MNGEEIALLKSDLQYIRETTREIKANMSSLAEMSNGHRVEMTRLDGQVQRHGDRLAQQEKQVAQLEKDVGNLKISTAKLSVLIASSASLGGLIGSIIQALVK